MQILPPISAPLRGGYLNSAAVTVEISDGEWAVRGVEWQDTSCGCAAEFPICAPHTKSQSNAPTKSTAAPVGIESSYACTPPFPRADLQAMAARVVDISTEDRVAFNVAVQLAALPPATLLPGVYGLAQGLAVLLTAVYAAGRGIIHLNPYDLALLMERNMIIVDSSGNVSSAIGGHNMIANPYVAAGLLIFTGYAKVLLSTIQPVSTFDHLTNIQREGAERHLAIALNSCGARQVAVAL